MADAKKDVKKKPKLTSAKKRDLQNKKRAIANKSCRAELHTMRVDLEKLLAAKGAGVEEKLLMIQSKIDKAVKRGVWKANKASRIKSRTAKKALAAKA